MSSKRQLRRKQCGDKMAYADQETAKRHAKAHADFLLAYKCPFCNKWHYGHPNRRQKQSFNAIKERLTLK